MEPSGRSYGGVIMSLARSGEREYVGEAFRLAREMLGGGVGGSGVNRDAYGRGKFRPDQLVFLALLEGAKRMGDLPRVRWILAEMVRTVEEGSPNGPEGGKGEVVINEEVMMYVFNAYAAYKPPFKRSLAPLVKDVGTSPAPASPASSSAPITTSPSPSTSTTPTTSSSSPTSPTPSYSSTSTSHQQHERAQTSVKPSSHSPNTNFSHVPPQSRSEVLREAKAIFTQIVDAQSLHNAHPEPTPKSFPSIFRNVRLTTPLLNSYLSIHYAHSSLEASHKLFLDMFNRYGPTLKPDERSLVEALERCAMPIKVEKDHNRLDGHGGVEAKSEKEQEREVALRFAEDVWREWEVVEERNVQRQGENSKERVGARMVERANSAMIRILALYVFNALYFHPHTNLAIHFFNSQHQKSSSSPLPPPHLHSPLSPILPPHPNAPSPPPLHPHSPHLPQPPHRPSHLSYRSTGRYSPPIAFVARFGGIAS